MLRRSYRAVRVSAHLLTAIAKLAVVFPLVDQPRRRMMIGQWSRKLLRLLRIDARIHGLPEEGLPGNLLIVANHVSWLDIFVLNTLRPSRFIAKSELRRWPVLGRVITSVGTLYLERGRSRDAHRINRHTRDVLAGGDTVAVFPEGTTTDGTTLLPFKASLLQPVIDADGHIQPIALRYRRADGGHNPAAAYIGEMNFVQSLWRILGERTMVVELVLAPPLRAGARHRRELSREAEIAIRKALALPENDSAPEISADRQA